MKLQVAHVLPRSESIFCVHSLPSYFISVTCGLIRAADKLRCVEARMDLPSEYGFQMSALPMLRIVLKHVGAVPA